MEGIFVNIKTNASSIFMLLKILVYLRLRETLRKIFVQQSSGKDDNLGLKKMNKTSDLSIVSYNLY